MTCIDNGMPVVLLRARDLGCSGYESPAQLEADSALKARLESAQAAAAQMQANTAQTVREAPARGLGRRQSVAQ